ncbi:hypothetical protein ACIA8K_12790 [Catenuloplanes sp. NPDC051500]|uniref:hypothetical protein n=1 Tax=Catenuloplanes sp. NPDC051500 TaxID=3363959 RepID=UPI00379B05DF
MTETTTVNLLRREITTLSELAALPVGAIIEDRDGDQAERDQHGVWRSASFPGERLHDTAVAAFYLPATVLNADELEKYTLDGFRLGDLAKVVTNDYAIAVSAGRVGLVERISQGHLYLRFPGGIVLPLEPDEVAAIGSAGIEPGATVEVTADAEGQHQVRIGRRGFVIARVVTDHFEPHWLVQFDLNSPWFTNGAVMPETCLKVASPVRL